MVHGSEQAPRCVCRVGVRVQYDAVLAHGEVRTHPNHHTTYYIDTLLELPLFTSFSPFMYPSHRAVGVRPEPLSMTPPCAFQSVIILFS